MRCLGNKSQPGEVFFLFFFRMVAWVHDVIVSVAQAQEGKNPSDDVLLCSTDCLSLNSCEIIHRDNNVRVSCQTL